MYFNYSREQRLRSLSCCINMYTYSHICCVVLSNFNHCKYLKNGNILIKVQDNIKGSLIHVDNFLSDMRSKGM